MNDIRFACQKCGQRLACEPPSLGTRIQCPACKQRILVPTAEILECYQLLELGPRAPFDEVRQAHLDRVKVWAPDGSVTDPEWERRAAEKTNQLNQALQTITAYLTSTYTGPRAPVKSNEEPRPAPESKPRPAPEKRAEPKSTQPAAAARPSAGARGLRERFPMQWLLAGVGTMVGIALLVWLVMGLLQRPGLALTNESTGTQWLQANEAAKRAYCRAVLVELEQKGLLRKSGLRVNDAFFYDGLESACRQKNPDDLNSRLVDLSTKLIGGQR
jgi:DNA-directed RNA polymerase subunit RPC12/RpoP